jgi:hypothetical protein
MINSSIILRAKQGDPQAIAQLIPFWVVSEGITVQVSIKQDCLIINLYSQWSLDSTKVIQSVRQHLLELAPANLRQVEITFQLLGEQQLAWRSHFELTQVSHLVKPKKSNIPHQDLGLLFLAKFNLLKLTFIALLGFHLLFGASHYTVAGFLRGSDRLMIFLHNVNLIFHEAGHIFFAFFGQFIAILGGSLMQILIPLIIAIHFFLTKQYYASTIALWWVGQNFLDVSIYVKDGKERILPLLGGEGVIHDWHYLLSSLHWLAYDNLIGNIIFIIGLMISGSALFMGVYFSQSRFN